MSHYDHIPKGMKEKYNEKTQEWDLVPLSDESPDDLRVMLSEKEAVIKELEAEVCNLKAELAKHVNSKKR